TLRGGTLQNGNLFASAYNLERGSVTAVFGGSAKVVKTTDGLVDLLSVNTYTGGTEIRGGTLRLGGNDRLLAAGSLLVTSGSFDLGSYSQTLSAVAMTSGMILNGTLTASGFIVDSGTVTARLSGAGSLVKNTEGTLTLGNQNDYVGGTTINGGTLALGVNDALLSTGSVTLKNGVLSLGVTTQTVGVMTLAGGLLSGGMVYGAAYAVEAGTVETVLAGTAALVKSGSGTVTLNTANSYVGGTTVNGGTLLLGATDRLADAGVLNIAGGVFNLGGYNETVGVVTLNGGLISNGILTGSAYSVLSGEVSALLAGSGALTKTSVGLVTLTANNSYSGGTTVSAGTLALGVTNALLGSGSVTLNGGELALGTTSQLVGEVTLVSGLISGGILTGSSYRLESGTITSELAGTASVVKNNTGTVLL
ncbi:MAG: hypothetical protein EBV83_10200, partial [Verrucomicrobia bacterium]|nr:hypothetical protein [Verrucomicrobiota bacterium]